MTKPWVRSCILTDISSPFRRDHITWLAYLMLAFFTFVPSVFGPIMPFLRQDLSLSYAQGGLYMTALSAGMILTGLFGDRFAHRFGRRLTLWCGAVGIALAALCLALARSFPLTLFSSFLMGISGSSIQLVVQATLSDRHGERRAIALSEANIGASLSSAVAPLLIAAFLYFGLSWKTTLYFSPLFLVLLFGFFRRTDLSPSSRAYSSAQPSKFPLSHAPLPPSYWTYWFAILLFDAVEWCLNTWGAEFTVSRLGFTKTAASAAMGLYMAAAVLGRAGGSRLARLMKASTILVIAVLVCLAAFPIFWLIPLAVLAIPAFLVTNLGVSNLFPFGMSLAVGTASTQAERASARISLAVGLAGISAPLTLGWLADRIGLYQAFTFVAVLLVVGLILSWIANARMGHAISQ